MTGRLPIRAVCSLLVSVLFLSVFLSVSVAQTGGDSLTPIAAALENKDFDKALRLLHAALEQSPTNPQLWTMQGMAYNGKGNKQQALASFRSALRTAPDYLPALHSVAQFEYEASSAAGIPVLQHLLRLVPGDTTGQGMLAVLEYQQGNYAAAAVHFEKTGALFDSQPDALHAYATCLVKLKKYDKSVVVFQRALALNPNDRRERQVLASLQLMAHRPQDAIATLTPLLAERSPGPDTLELASAAYERARDTERAVDLLRQAILVDPGYVNLYLDFANISSVHQSFQVGIDVVNDGIALSPKAAPLYFARGVLHTQLGQYDQAEADFETAYELDPSLSLTTAVQGLAAVQANDPERALATIQARLAQKPNDPLLLYMQADILTEKGAAPGTPEFQLAMRSAKKAVALQPALGEARSVLAKLYLQSGQYPEAVNESKKALSLNPKDQASVYHLIQALRKTKNRNEIPELLKRLAALREQATREERERYRYRLADEDSSPKQP